MTPDHQRSIPRPEFLATINGIRITSIDYLWQHAANPEGTYVSEAGLTKNGNFILCQHGMDHRRAVDMIVNCLEHGLDHRETAEHVQAVGTRYRDSLWGGDDEDWDWKRPKAKIL